MEWLLREKSQMERHAVSSQSVPFLGTCWSMFSNQNVARWHPFQSLYKSFTKFLTFSSILEGGGHHLPSTVDTLKRRWPFPKGAQKGYAYPELTTVATRPCACTRHLPNLSTSVSIRKHGGEKKYVREELQVFFFSSREKRNWVHLNALIMPQIGTHSVVDSLLHVIECW